MVSITEGRTNTNRTIFITIQLAIAILRWNHAEWLFPYENRQPDWARNRPVSGHNPIFVACLGRDTARHAFCITPMCEEDICPAQVSAKIQPERTKQIIDSSDSAVTHLSRSCIGENWTGIEWDKWLVPARTAWPLIDHFARHWSCAVIGENSTGIGRDTVQVILCEPVHSLACEKTVNDKYLRRFFFAYSQCSRWT